MQNLANDALMQDLGTLLSFFQLDLTSIDPSYPITYWVQSVAATASGGAITNSPILWTLEYPEGSTPQAIIWNPIDLQADQWETSSQGSLPRPHIRLANVLGAFTPSIIEYGIIVWRNIASTELGHGIIRKLNALILAQVIGTSSETPPRLQTISAGNRKAIVSCGFRILRRCPSGVSSAASE